MAGLTKATPVPVALTAHRASRTLELGYDDGRTFALPFELLRVLSPSAEVQGHGPGQQVLQTGKREVTIDAIEPVGHYGIRPIFSDGHASGIYTWDYLYHLACHQQPVWEDYLAQLQAAGLDRDAPMPAPGRSGHG